MWEDFLSSLEPRPVAERERMRGFLLALRDGAMEGARGDRALGMPADVPDRLAALGFLDAEGERYRLALQRARKWMWELGVPVASERRDAIGKLAGAQAQQLQGQLQLPFTHDLIAGHLAAADDFDLARAA